MDNETEWSGDGGTERLRGARFWKFDGAMKGKEIWPTFLCSLGQQDSLAREMWERMIVPIKNYSFI